ncbi:(2Fe-2S) ferredoxin domain-containing protein [Clostridium grantii]|uniref:Thioredoxin-like [2Fe-2S] ferredoxin n=1 Tax=Clostridium grantii DSM 8605 TaxID=1121316 RepID=A0A1M5XSS2_9CLOT|nr:NAD(P)H-dependent oxidoreductase subunit E [Clostridium grantii]SHI02857.1 Thioredoxin-like [2Fe-2S] ferredoxin [Clostridium grantii DSM 8605]
MIIYVCIGSACHLKGSYDVIKEITDLVEVNNMKDKVIIKAAFCLGRCTEAVSVRIGEDEYFSVNKANVYEFFSSQVLGRI